jgi:hypothetical protein
MALPYGHIVPPYVPLLFEVTPAKVLAQNEAVNRGLSAVARCGLGQPLGDTGWPSAYGLTEPLAGRFPAPVPDEVISNDIRRVGGRTA